MAWLTTQPAAAEILCRRFSIPVNLVPAFMGALDELTNSRNWERYDLLTPDDDAALFLDILSSFQDGCMIGTIFPYLTDAPPAGSLSLDGSTYNNADYPKLVSAGIATWDNGDGTFTLPDSRGRAIAGAGNGAGLTARTLGDSVGVEAVTLTTAEMPSHVHADTTTGVTAADPIAGVPLPAASVAAPSTTGATGGGGAHENMQPTIFFPLAVWVS